MKSGPQFDWADVRARLEGVREAFERSARAPEELARILAERAERLSRPAQARSEGSRAQEILIVALGAERFGIPLASVSEIIARPAVAAVPGAPAAVAGVMQVRGEIRPIFNLARLMNLPEALALANSTAVLLRRGRREAGILVERIDDVRAVREEDRRSAPPGSARVAWMTSDLVPVLDPGEILPEEMA